jgi:hypothetical protein
MSSLNAVIAMVLGFFVLLALGFLYAMIHDRIVGRQSRRIGDRQQRRR